MQPDVLSQLPTQWHGVWRKRTQAHTQGPLPAHQNSNDAQVPMLFRPTLISPTTNALFLHSHSLSPSFPLPHVALQPAGIASEVAQSRALRSAQGPLDPWSIAVLRSAIEQANKWSGHTRVTVCPVACPLANDGRQTVTQRIAKNNRGAHYGVEANILHLFIKV